MKRTPGRCGGSYRPTRRACVLLVLCTTALPSAHAHLMVAQRGTVNVVDDGAFMVLSVPVSAFEGVDDDGDGRLSSSEFEAHRMSIAETVTGEVRLFDEHGPHPLHGLMLTPTLPDDDPTGSASQLIAMGRFALDDPEATLRIELGLFGTEEAEQALKLTATRRATDQRQNVKLTSTSPVRVILPAP